MRLDGPVDLLARWRPRDGFLFEQRRLGVVGVGELRKSVVSAGTAPADAVAQGLLDDVGIDGAVAVGALPFAGDTASALVVPGQVTVTSLRPRRLDLAVTSRVAASAAGPTAPIRGTVRWRAEPTSAEYAAAVAEATRLVRADTVEKVVLSRSLSATIADLDVGRLLAALRERDADCHLFAVPVEGGGTFLGASPETLLRREADSLISLPLAGTAARSADPAADAEIAAALLRSVKDRREHTPVVAAVADILTPFCNSLSVDPEPHLVATGAVWHLATAIRGRLRPSAPSALGLATALHPTPAVCGTPRAAASDVIARLEPMSRGLYAGLVGWVDNRGDGEWAVSLRCALVSGDGVRLHAGAGIVAGSDPAAEVAETDVKFRTLIDAVASTLEVAEAPLPAR